MRQQPWFTLSRSTTAMLCAALSTFLVSMAAVVTAASPARAEQRIAIAIGIDAYRELPALAKARNDADAIAATLRRLGFEVVVVPDPTRLDLLGEWDLFLARIKPGATVAVFYAGHAMQLEGGNLLLGVDTPKTAQGPEVLRAYGIPLSRMLDAVRAKKPAVSLFIIDACRDDPFVASGTRSAGAATRGLAGVDAAGGEFIMYSAAAGEQALDRLNETDANTNSVYTRELLPLLADPSRSILQVAKEVQQRVEAAARTRRDARGLAEPHRQRPAYYDGIVGEYYLAQQGAAVVAANSPAAMAPATSPAQTRSADAGSALRGAAIHLPLPDDPNAREVREALRKLLPQRGLTLTTAPEEAEYFVRPEVTLQRSEEIGRRTVRAEVRLRCRHARLAATTCALEGLSASAERQRLTFNLAEDAAVTAAIERLGQTASTLLSKP